MSTYQDLMAAFAGESQARNKYLAFARKAEEEGYPQVAKLFRAAAQAEYIHAQNHFKAADEIKSTAENLQAAIQGENYEVVSMYPPFIEAAKAEGNKRAQTSFEWAWKVEATHEALYREALEGLSKEMEEFDYYVCPVCGHTHPRNAPNRCPVCGAPGGKFIKVE
ncbi:MAG TPA: rubrerythrin family protein [Anaerolinea thermolimosa]|uniref:Rubrerythrin family protein n=1 Tax=Anaerolinea thermolimosa TaxID=229919 RepID=A0A3D1JJE5_9CHLR|nr:rubrerythrin family protein [Anaerolinea thermolimosa]GAP07409.1 rubrerythrin [Anaerolinea thermolimosa]HCE18623.1 rubrerythrin family protein [Anaerolinea thermolimosa]